MARHPIDKLPDNARTEDTLSFWCFMVDAFVISLDTFNQLTKPGNEVYL